jgi:hypothetical protein
MRARPRPLSFLITAALAAPLTAQTSAPLKSAAATITEGAVTRRIGIIADDSMMGRDTPSPGLEMTAHYVADQFKSFGLAPGGETGSYFLRYSIERKQLDPGGSSLVLDTKGPGASRHVAVDFRREARFVFGGVPRHPVTGSVLLVSGPLTQEGARAVDGKGKLILLVLDYSKPLSGSTQQAVAALGQTGAAAIVIISNRDSAAFAQRVANQGQPHLSVEGDESQTFPPFVEVLEQPLSMSLQLAGVNPQDLRAGSSLVARPVPGLSVVLDLKERVLQTASAPISIGVLEGSDPKLKNEYVVYSAHMDHIGITPGQKDSINNGADDDGSGTVGVIELAQAFSQRGARPRRSMIFMTVSGEEKGLWGSRYFSEHPTIPLSQIVADINIDMIGRNWKDTIVAIGKEHSDLGATLNRVNAAHPELHMTAIDDRWPEENFYFRSDHFNFARKGVPILFFFNGVHADYHQVTDSPDKIDGEKEARILQLLFYLGQEVGNAESRPRWNPESYKKIVEGAK